MNIKSSHSLLLLSFMTLTACVKTPESSKLAEKQIEEKPVVNAKARRTNGYNKLRNPYFGEKHLHTGWSFDDETILIIIHRDLC